MPDCSWDGWDGRDDLRRGGGGGMRRAATAGSSRGGAGDGNRTFSFCPYLYVKKGRLLDPLPPMANMRPDGPDRPAALVTHDQSISCHISPSRTMPRPACCPSWRSSNRLKLLQLQNFRDGRDAPDAVWTWGGGPVPRSLSHGLAASTSFSSSSSSSPGICLAMIVPSGPINHTEGMARMPKVAQADVPANACGQGSFRP